MRNLSKQFIYLTGMMHDVYGNSTQSTYYGNKPLSRRRTFLISSHLTHMLLTLTYVKKTASFKLYINKLSKQDVFLTGDMHCGYGKNTQPRYYGHAPLEIFSSSFSFTKNMR